MCNFYVIKRFSNFSSTWSHIIWVSIARVRPRAGTRSRAQKFTKFGVQPLFFIRRYSMVVLYDFEVICLGDCIEIASLHRHLLRCVLFFAVKNLSNFLSMESIFLEFLELIYLRIVASREIVCLGFTQFGGCSLEGAPRSTSSLNLEFHQIWHTTIIHLRDLIGMVLYDFEAFHSNDCVKITSLDAHLLHNVLFFAV